MKVRLSAPVASYLVFGVGRFRPGVDYDVGDTVGTDLIASGMFIPVERITSAPAKVQPKPEPTQADTAEPAREEPVKKEPVDLKSYLDFKDDDLVLNSYARYDCLVPGCDRVGLRGYRRIGTLRTHMKKCIAALEMA